MASHADAEKGDRYFLATLFDDIGTVGGLTVEEMASTYGTNLSEDVEKEPTWHTGIWFHVLFLIALRSSQSVLKGKAVLSGTSFNYNSVCLFQGLVSIGVSLGICFFRADTRIFSRRFLIPSPYWFPPAVLFIAATYTEFSSLAMLELTVYQESMLSQTYLFMVAVIQRLWLGEKQTWAAWASILLITLSTFTFFMMQDFHDALCSSSPKIADEWSDRKRISIALSLSSTLCRSVGSVYLEKMFKGSQETPFYLQKLQIDLVSVVTVLLCYGVPNAVPTLESRLDLSDAPGFLHFPGMEFTMFGLVACQTSMLWFTGLIMKRSGALSVSMVNSVAPSLTYPVSFLLNAVKESQCPAALLICIDNLKMLDPRIMISGFAVSTTAIGFVFIRLDYRKLVTLMAVHRCMREELRRATSLSGTWFVKKQMIKS